MGGRAVTEEALSCPACGARTIPIIHGFPGREGFELAERGEAEIGGCIVSEDMPDRACTGRPKHSLRDGRVLGTLDDPWR